MNELRVQTKELEFSYEAFTGRNVGFISPEEQDRLRRAAVFVCGVGGMGGAAVLSLVRAGVGTLAVADFDRFDISNLNRQVFATLETVGQLKADATIRQLRLINPEVRLEAFSGDWADHLDELLQRYHLVINGMDDLRQGILLYRQAKKARATVIDAYTSPLPSVTVVRPEDPRPEERLRFPSASKPWNAITGKDIAECITRELEYVLIHSSSAAHVDLTIAADVLAGTKPRPSFAPMVITTGNLMCFEALKVILGRKPTANCHGYFFNPWTMRIEYPKSAATAWLRKAVVRRQLAKLLGDSETQT